MYKQPTNGSRNDITNINTLNFLRKKTYYARFTHCHGPMNWVNAADNIKSRINK